MEHRNPSAKMGAANGGLDSFWETHFTVEFRPASASLGFELLAMNPCKRLLRHLIVGK
jgi:hypothetical protein